MMDVSILEKQAIKAALEGQWNQAIKINQSILKVEPKNIPALNRLARSFWEKGQTASAKKTYSSVLSIDRYNPIAVKNLKKIAECKRKRTRQDNNLPFELFLEEPGKTKLVKLTHLAQPKILSALDSGNRVNLLPRKRVVMVTTNDGVYLGTIPEDLSQRLIQLIKGGNQYDAIIKAVDCHELEIFLRENSRGQRFRNHPSFPLNASDFIPQPSAEDILQEELDLTPTGETEEEKT